MNYTCLLDYIRDHQGSLKMELWSGIKMALDTGENVPMPLPHSLEEFDQQFAILIKLGAIAEINGRWQAMEIRRPPRVTQQTMFKP